MRSIAQALAVIGIVLTSAYSVHWHNEEIKTLQRNADFRTRFIIASQQAGTGIIEIQSDTGKIQYADDITCNMFGYKAGTMEGVNLSEVIPGWKYITGSDMATMALDASMAHEKSPHVAVARCIAYSNDGKSLDVLTRFYLSEDKSALFASVNMAENVYWSVLKNVRVEP